jgi:hypothetical protein
VVTAGDILASRTWLLTSILNGNTSKAIGTETQLADTKGLTRRGDYTSTMTIACHVFAWVIRQGFLANAILQCKPGVTNTNWPLGTNGTATMATTVDPNAVILELLAAITTSNEKHCNQRQHSL